jgi:hypothetical protein
MILREAQIMYVMFSSELLEGMYLGDRPMVVLKPPRLPRDWDGVVFRRGGDDR